jgi:cysteinyl-tRNA synthetase
MKIFDTLSKSDKNLDNDKIIKWYMCGPTVYDHAHLGHARNYITNDILIRILNHFGYKTVLTMNITDIDDKIIKKANETYKDPNEWKKITSRFEKSFLEDLISLNIQMPNILTRVSDYMEEVVGFIQRLIERCYAYKSENSSSVYFDTKYYYDSKHSDGFDVPPNVFDEEISDQKFVNEKKDSRDFALWKEAKQNEPSWPSPWGIGRPGWHIECSAMCNSVFGDELTIHSGGVDLKFPHHENERKQCIGHNENTGWPNIFVHIGHLHIDGLKMSKSLKNFVTIKDVIQKYNANVLRMFCLMHKYSDPVDFSEEHLDQVSGVFKTIIEFLARTEHFVKDESNKLNLKKQTQEEIKAIMDINNLLLEIEQDLANNFDTVSVVKKIIILTEFGNKYNENYNISSLVYNNIMQLLFMFGFKFDNKNDNDVKLINVIRNMRDDIRNYAKQNKQNGLYQITDKIRNDLRDIGVNLDDKK